jgi:hypothetical protein
MANPKPKPGPGRPKGSKNKLTASIKEAIERAFEEVGGQSYLAKVAQEDPRTFCTLLGKLLPMQVTGEDGAPIKAKVTISLD